MMAIAQVFVGQLPVGVHVEGGEHHFTIESLRAFLQRCDKVGVELFADRARLAGQVDEYQIAYGLKRKAPQVQAGSFFRRVAVDFRFEWNVVRHAILAVTPAVIGAYQRPDAVGLGLYRILPVHAEIFKRAQFAVEVLHDDWNSAQLARDECIVLGQHHLEADELPERFEKQLALAFEPVLVDISLWWHA